MVTLTYPTDPDPDETREHLRSFRKRLTRVFPDLDYGWCIEGTKNGRVHFHFFIGDGGGMGEALDAEKCETITRKGKQYQICRGAIEALVVKSWCEVVEKAIHLDSDTLKNFHAFQKGGILEKLNSPDAAARYVSKEASKRTQKGEGVNLGKGCFWRLARHLKARARWISDVTKEGRELLPSYSRIFDSDTAKELCAFTDFEQIDMREDELRESQRIKNRERIERKAEFWRLEKQTRWDNDWMP